MPRAANHDGALVDFGGLDHPLRIGNIAIGKHAGQLDSGQRWQERVGTGRQQQAVIRCFGAILGHHLAPHPINLRDAPAGVQGDPVFAVPIPVIQYDRAELLLTRQNRREQDPVVIGLRLGAKHRDVVLVGRNFDQFL